MGNEFLRKIQNIRELLGPGFGLSGRPEKLDICRARPESEGMTCLPARARPESSNPARKPEARNTFLQFFFQTMFSMHET